MLAIHSFECIRILHICSKCFILKHNHTIIFLTLGACQRVTPLQDTYKKKYLSICSLISFEGVTLKQERICQTE